MEIGKFLIICVISALLCLIHANYKPEFSMAATIAAGALIFISALTFIVPAITELSDLFSAAGIENGYFKIAFKALGICIVSQFAADTCRDFGQTALAAKAEFIGRCGIFLLCIPLIKNILEAAVSLIGEV